MIKILKKGFTLVELVVVIAIVAVLSAVSVGGYFVFIEKAKKTEAEVFAYTIANYVRTLKSPVTFNSNDKSTDANKPTRNFTLSFAEDGLNIKVNYSAWGWDTSSNPLPNKMNYDVKLGSYGIVSGAISRFLSFYFEKKDIIYDGLNNKVSSDSAKAERYAVAYGNDTNYITLGSKDKNGIYNNVKWKDKTKNGSDNFITDRGIFIGNRDKTGLVPSLKNKANIDTISEVKIHELYYISSYGNAYLIEF